MIGILLIALTLMLALSLVAAARGQAVSIRELSELDGKTQQVDLQAFRNLIDRSESAYLQTHLPAAQFRKVQRERMQAALEYLGRISHNAAALVRVGEANRRNPATEIADAAHVLLNEAFQLRLLAIHVRLMIYLEILLPGHSAGISSFVGRYERLTESALRLCSFQSPQRASHLLTIL